MSIPEPRVGHISFTYKNFVGVLGGYHDRMGDDRILTNYSSLRDLWIYDTDLEKWILKITDFAIDEYKFYGMSGAACQIYKDTLYIFAGFTYTSRTNNLYLLDMKSLLWSKVQNFPKNVLSWNPAPRDKLVTWLFDNRIYFFGGYGPKMCHDSQQKHLGSFILDINNESNGWNNDTFAFDILKHTWVPLYPKGDAPSPRAAHACAQIRHKAYVFGGRTRNSRMCDLYAYDCTKNTWSGSLKQNGPQKPIGRSWHSFTAINDSHIFLYGGFTTEGEILNDGWLLNTENLTWKVVEINFAGPRLWHSSTLTQHGEVLIFGGSLVNIMQSQQTRQSNEILIYRPCPKSLVRQCLGKLMKNEVLARQSLSCLPPQLAHIVKSGMEGG